MKTLSYLLLLIIATAISCSKSEQRKSPTYLHTKGQNIVNESGTKIYLKGVGLGNWLLPEGYMWKFGKSGDKPRKIEKIVSDLIGQKNAKNFWKELRQNYISEDDIKRIAELGFNSVRPALNSLLFYTRSGVQFAFNDKGFHLLDSLISWCRKYHVYVVIAEVSGLLIFMTMQASAVVERGFKDEHSVILLTGFK